MKRSRLVIKISGSDIECIRNPDKNRSGLSPFEIWTRISDVDCIRHTCLRLDVCNGIMVNSQQRLAIFYVRTCVHICIEGLNLYLTSFLKEESDKKGFPCRIKVRRRSNSDQTSI